MENQGTGRMRRLTTGLWLLAVAVGFFAAGPSPGAVAVEARNQDSVLRSYDIAAAELATVLLRFAEQSDVQLSVDVALTKGKRSPGIKGKYTLDAALRILLDGNGLMFRMTGPRTIVIEKASDADGD
jgi:Secretin and TonB N terminus short domain